MRCVNCEEDIGYTGGFHDDPIEHLRIKMGRPFKRYLCSPCIERGWKFDSRTATVRLK